MPAHGLCQPTGNWSSTTHWVMAGALLWHLFPTVTCCGSFTGSPGIPIWGRQHITLRRGSHQVLGLLWVLRAVPRAGKIRHPQWVLLRELSWCSGVKEWGIYARTNWASMPEPEGHSCKNTPGDHAWTNWALVH